MILRIYKTLLIFSCFKFIITYTPSLPKIAIVGGGIGGTSCAYFLRELFGNKADITLYERDLIGGRLNLIDVDGNKYEAGGAVIHSRNKYMMEFANMLGLSMKKPEASKFGVYNGEKLIFVESDWYISTLIKFFWRYGLSIISLWKDVQWMLNEFSSIYDLQAAKFSFTTVNGLLDYMNKNFRNLTQVTLAAHLQGQKLSKAFLDELVQAVMMVNYGQTNNISAFAGFVSLAGADTNLWSIDSGNKNVPEGLLKKSGAKVVKGDVTEIILLKDGNYTLKYVEPSGSVSYVDYNIVIIANPLIKELTNIKFRDFRKNYHQYETKFQRTVATFVKGSLNPAAFNAEELPEEILVCQPHLLFNSIGKVTPVSRFNDKGKDVHAFSNVYKVFSAEPLSQQSIHHLFKNVEIMKEKDWLAYPYYEPPENLPPFLFYPGLYYINAIELAASAMEMSAIGAKNVALLAFNLWHNMLDKVDHYSHIYKEEL